MMDDSIQTSFSIAGKKFDRVRYGDEKEDWGQTGSPVTTAASGKARFTSSVVT
jgi:hypothetical protein